jgi:mono/diheme cytochrome c family protein
MDAIELPTIQAAFKDSNARVRAHAIRISERFFNSEEKPDAIESLLALTNDSDTQVSIQLALTLGQARQKDTDAAMSSLANQPGENAFLTDAILSGLSGRELDALQTLLKQSDLSHAPSNTITLARGLSECIMTSRNPETVDHLLQIAASTSSITERKTLMDGMIAGKQKKPVRFKDAPESLLVLEKSDAQEIKSRVAKLDPSLVWQNKPGVPPDPIIPPLTIDQQARFEEGKQLFAGSCAACHQLHGLGMEGLAPPLVDSEWVLGADQRLVRIVLHGLTGPLKVNGRSYHLDMPSMGSFDDEQLASILTYIRRAWENTGNPISPEEVKQVRAATSKRQEAWSQPELLSLK